MTAAITTTSSLQTLWRLFATCEDLIIDSPKKFVETAFGFVEKVLKVTTYISVTVAKVHLLSFICLQVKTIQNRFTNLAATWFVPLVIYFDFESFLRLVSACKRPSDKAVTQVKEIHEPCGFALTVIDHHSSMPTFHHVDSSPVCITNFVKMLHKLARDIYQQKRKHPFFKGDWRNLGKSIATHCWICEKLFSEAEYPENTIDLDHCHYSGKFLGWAHEKWNRLRRNINFTPVVGHKIQKYDWHHICLALNNREPTTTISVIPSTDETTKSTYQWHLVCLLTLS